MVNSNGVPNLPHDLIIEILTRLPPRAICKFRCVSKQWYHLLTHDDDFIGSHAEWSRQNPLLLIRNYVVDENAVVSKNKSTVGLTSVDMKGRICDAFKIVVDGIVVRLISCGPITILCSISSIYVCNPSFHETVLVPYHSRSPLQSIGIGFDPCSMQYKIVHLFKDLYTREPTMDCEVLSFRNCRSLNLASWKIRYGVCGTSAYTDKSPLCVGGNIYWARSAGRDNRSILSFNLEEEAFSTLDYPSSERRSHYSFVGIKGSMCVVGCSTETSTMDVWKLEMDDKTWIMEHSIDLFPFVVNFLVCSDRESEEIVMHTDQEGLVSYDIKSRTSTRIKYFEGVRTCNKPCLHPFSSVLKPHISILYFILPLVYCRDANFDC